MDVWREPDPHGWRLRQGLVHRAAMRHSQKPLFQFRRESMRKMNGNVYMAHSMRILCHGPFRLDTQPLLRNVVSRAEFPDEISDTARNRPHKEFHRAEAGILAAISNRLIGHDPVLAAANVETRAAMIRG